MSGYSVIGMGNAIVDVLSHCDDSFLDHMGIEKGIMQLVERERAETLYGAMEERRQVAGGSVANTLAGLGALGVSAGLIGKVRDDALGRFYASAMPPGSTFLNEPVSGAQLPSSRSMIFVTPDGERSMNTYLGISAELGAEDLPEEEVRGADILFLEGYLFDKSPGKQAFLRAADLVRSGGGRAGIALSDPFCVDRHREDFRSLVAGPMDFVIGNREEWMSLYQTETLDAAMELAVADCDLVVCTRSGESVWLFKDGERAEAEVSRVVPVDATGAGDQFAAGFLYGLVTGKDLETCGRMGCIAATEVIGHFGARPEADIKALFRDAGLI
ncbi:adenosine kinase [Roseicyclus sp. F158]|uniref:Adenosine kinase n=1 Tax=Tropicimonas omnivorans TaxID=3075590 RepID=A0ABU3DDR4_9RHOB|nr:adenosine kinase [Roseicyclus sp. F158]MDT0681810.1 adenosine kinase [Roseicyclus sp. F158]